MIKMIQLRPFYFFVVLWGATFRRYLLRYCLPSLLAPHNLPSLTQTHQNKLLICTTQEDWRALLLDPVIIALQTYLEIVWLEIPPPPPHVSSYQHMGVGHKMATMRCFQDQAYGIALTPDMLMADGTLSAVQKHALNGIQVIFCGVVRLAEETFFADLVREGIGTQDNLPTSDPVVLSPRQLVALNLKNFHSETECYDFNSAAYRVHSPMTLWRLPDQQGLILHSLSWCPVLIDYGAIHSHSTQPLEDWTIDGDYIYTNFKDCPHIYVCQDSDEMMLSGWSPIAQQRVKIKHGWLRQLFNPFCHVFNQYLLRETLINPMFDPLKRTLFPIPVRWHVKDCDASWSAYEKKIHTILTQPRRWDDVLFHYTFISVYYGKKIIKYAFLFLLLCLGNRSAKQQIMERTKLLFSE